MPLHVSCRADDADKHEADVNNLVFQKGKLYSAGDGGKIKVWASDLQFIAEVQAHTTPVFSLTSSDDTLYSCSNDGTIKAWAFESLKEKGVVLKEDDTEIWKIKYNDGILYSGDDQGNVRVYKNGSHFGLLNVAEPVKDLVVNKNLLFTVKDNDVVVTDLHLEGEKLQFGTKITFMGRGPLFLISDKLFFISRDGKDIIVHDSLNKDHFKEITQVKGAHELIINALTGAIWDGKTFIFSGGWDKLVKKWILENDTLKEVESCDVDIVVNALSVGEKGEIYAAGSDGHIVRVEF